MSSPFATYPAPERSFIPSSSSSSSNRGAAPPPRGTGAKRGRKPKVNASESPQLPSQNPQPGPNQTGELQWMSTGTSADISSSSSISPSSPNAAPLAASGAQQQQQQQQQQPPPQQQSSQQQPQPTSTVTTDATQATSSVLQPGSTQFPVVASDAGVSRAGTAAPGAVAGDEDVEGEDEMLPAMADDDYSAQLSWQSQSKDNLKVLMDNFSPAQYDRFEAYRRHALPKQAVRKVIQQIVGQQVSQPVAQVVAGFAKVFVGEIIEKALAVQQRRGDTGPLLPDHLREAYRMYQLETGRVGAARPLRGKKLFVQ